MIYDDPVLGVDVSMHQPNINWADIARECDFAWIKTSEGNGYADPWFDRHSTRARGTGILWGGYHYALSNGPDWYADATVEADWFVYAGGMSGSIPGALDMEHTDLDRETTIRWARRWCDRVKERAPQWASCRIPVYWGMYFAGTPAAMNDPRLADCWWWMPAYQRNNPPTPNPYGAHVGWGSTNGPRIPEGWQYTSQGRIPGWVGGVDLSVAPRRNILELARLLAPQTSQEDNDVRTMLWAMKDSRWARDVARLGDPTELDPAARHCFAQDGMDIMFLGTADPARVHDPAYTFHSSVIGVHQYFARMAGREFVETADDVLAGYRWTPATLRGPRKSYVLRVDGTTGRIADLLDGTAHAAEATSRMALHVLDDWTCYVIAHDTDTPEGQSAVNGMKFIGAEVVDSIGPFVDRLRLTGEDWLIPEAV